jgi:hypothetical protein
LTLTSWPKLSPTPAAQEASARAQWKACSGVSEKALPRCTFGDPITATKSAVVIGDSYALAWMPMLIAALVPRHWVLYEIVTGQCPASYVSVDNTTSEPGLHGFCDQRHPYSITEANKLKPNLVILATAANTLSRLSSKATDSAAATEYQAGLQRTISLLNPSATRKVLTLSPPPDGGVLQVCDTPQSTPAACVKQITPEWQLFAAAEKKAATATHTAYANTRLWFCTATNYCPAFVGAVPVHWDGSHLSAAYSTSLAPEAAALIAKTMK